MTSASFSAVQYFKLQHPLAELSASPLTGAILGPIVPLTMEGAIMWRSMVQGAMVLMIAVPLVVIRHTRSEEASSRAEFYLSRPVGKFAPFMAALILSMGAFSLLKTAISAVGFLPSLLATPKPPTFWLRLSP